MTINEFLQELRQALIGEVPAEEISSNLRYYEGYMNEQRGSKSEEEITAALGDPRLIARTIIDTYQLSHGNQKHFTYESNPGQERNYSNTAYNNYSQEPEQSRTSNSGDNRYGRKPGVYIFGMPGWLLTVIVVFILMVVFSLVFWIGGIVIRLLFRFGLPLLLIYLGVSFIRNRTR